MLFTFSSSLPSVTCRGAHVLFTFSSSLPSVTCRRAHVLFTFSSSLPSVTCSRAHVLFTLFVFCLRIVVSNTFCFVVSLFCLSSTMFPISLDCPFLIAPSVFSNVYLARKLTEGERDHFFLYKGIYRHADGMGRLFSTVEYVTGS